MATICDALCEQPRKPKKDRLAAEVAAEVTAESEAAEVAEELGQEPFRFAANSGRISTAPRPNTITNSRDSR